MSADTRLWSDGVGHVPLRDGRPVGRRRRLVARRSAGAPRLTLQGWCLLGAVAFVGVQIPLASREAAGAEATQVVVSDLFMVALVLTSGLVMVRGRSARWLAFLGYLAVNALVLGSLSRYAVVNKVGGLALLVLACHAAIVTLRRAGPELTERVLTVLVNATTALSMIGIAVLLSGGSLTLPLGIRVNPIQQRVSGLMVDPNAFGGLVAVCLVVCLARWRPMGTASKWGSWLRLVVLVMALVLTYSRTAWIAGAVGLVVWYATSSARTRVRLSLGIAAVAVLALWRGLALPVNEQLAERRFTIDQRSQGALAALGDFARSPLVGIGTGNHVVENSLIVHNTYLWVLGELGIVGMAVFAWAAFGVVWTLRAIDPARRELQRTLICALSVMAVMGLGIEALYQRHLWILLAVAYAAVAPRGRSVS